MSTDAIASEILGAIRVPAAQAPPSAEAIDPLWWYSIATCNGMNRNLWLAPTNHHVVAMAKGICAECPARTACLLHGLAMEEPWLRHGIFGGYSAEERDHLSITQEEAEATWREEGVRLYLSAA